MRKRNFLITLAVLVVLAAAIGGAVAWYWNKTKNLNTVTFECDGGKWITATFDLANDAAVRLVLSDGRKLSVPHAISADGARYATADEKFVFWTRGNSAFIQEGGPITFANCALYETYRNDTYGFELKYPKDLVPEAPFKTFYHLLGEWRAFASEGDAGVPVIAIPIFRVDQGGVATGKYYPLYYSAELRVGVATSSQAVADCLKLDAGYTEEPHHTVTLNGVAFEEFDFQNAGMMQYVEGKSYRAVHDGACFAIEQLRAGSSYRDDTMTSGIPQDQLDASFAAAGDIAKTFRFTR